MENLQNINKNIIEYVNQNFNNFEFRKGQLEAIEKILYNILNNDKTTTIVSAPTGSGKSLINIISAGVLAKYYNLKSYILASDLSLWAQYESFLLQNQQLNFGMLKGMENYECLINEDTVTHGECKLAGISINKLFGKDNGGFGCANICKYVKDKKYAIDANVTLMTYALYFCEVSSYQQMLQNNILPGNIEPNFKPRDVVFCDECHNIPDIVQNDYSLSINFTDIKYCGAIYDYLSNKSNFTLFGNDNIYSELFDELSSIFTSKNNIYNTYKILCTKLVEEQNKDNIILILGDIIKYWNLFNSAATTIDNEFKKLFLNKEHITKEDRMMIKIIKRYFQSSPFSILKMLNIIDKSGGSKYLVKSINVDKDNNTVTTIQCSKEDVMIHESLLNITQRQVLLSATVGNIDDFKDNIGTKFISNNLIDFIDIESSFNFSQSPIYFVNRYKMSYNLKSGSLKGIIDIIYKICNKNNDNKGIIQTGSYEISKYIIDNAPLEIKNRLLYYNGSKEKNIAIDKHIKSKNTILIGPSLNEGIDLPGDLCRFIIITKVPYPNLSDNLVLAKIENFPGWYKSTTSNSIIQGIGRGNRYIDDWCKTYILDACFENLYKESYKQYPSYIRNRIKLVK